jgi:excinuclease ABC subunit C
LIKHFGSLDKIKQASVEDIAQLKGFNQKIAENIKQSLTF